MRRWFAFATLVLVLVELIALPAYAQRGGGRGRGMDESTLTKTSFESADKTIVFAVPPDVTLFTPDSPGGFGQVFKSGYMAYMVNLVHSEVMIGVKAMPGATEADLAGLRQTLDTNPPQAKQPGYTKVSVGSVKVGAKQDKDALEYVYTANSTKNEPMTTRQVVFLHGDKGYVVTCTAAEKDFASVNKRTFDALFHKIEFR